ncbi:MAG TPA: hypothetical protein PLN69_02300 [bacterium]|nr:hypothetical protein [bacterium]
MMDYTLDPIKRRIRALYPGVEICILDNSRDNVGGVLLVRNADPEFVEKYRLSMDYVMVSLEDDVKSDVLIVPIPDDEEQQQYEQRSY